MKEAKREHERRRGQDVNSEQALVVKSYQSAADAASFDELVAAWDARIYDERHLDTPTSEWLTARLEEVA